MSILPSLLLANIEAMAIFVALFYVLTRAFPWFTELRGGKTVLAHLVLGIATALFYWKLARRGPDAKR